MVREKLIKSGALGLVIGASALILFACSSLRHALFQSGAFDLGIYDQVVYLISQGQPPISSFLGFHHMGNHAAWVVYPLSLLYKIYPDVHWLLAVQAGALAIAALPTMASRPSSWAYRAASRSNGSGVLAIPAGI